MQSAQQYIDIHTHTEHAVKDVMAIINKYDQYKNLDSQKFYSLGIHPWYIYDPATQIAQLKEYAHSDTVIAIGECGLDRISGPDFELQQEVFHQQILLANQIQKPLIIHCVKAVPETLQLLSIANVPAVFHGFNRKWTVAAAILGKGHYLSFGTHLLTGNRTAAATLALCTPDRFFLETDNSGEKISAIYKAAAAIRKTDEDTLILQQQNNFKKVFG